MGRHDTDLAQYALRLVEYAELPQHRSSIVVDPFAGQTIAGVKRVHPTERKFDSPPSRRKTPPATKVCPANHHLNQNRILRPMPALYRDFQIRHRFHQLFIECADSIPSRVVFVPRLIIVVRRVAEGAENAFQIVSVLKANVLLYKGKPRGLPVAGMQNSHSVETRSPKGLAERQRLNTITDSTVRYTPAAVYQGSQPG